MGEEGGNGRREGTQMDSDSCVKHISELDLPTYYSKYISLYLAWIKVTNKIVIVSLLLLW